MNQKAFQTICETFDQAKVKYYLLNHSPCRTSAESAEARSKAGFPNVVGAKALVTKMTFSDNHTEFNVLVLAGIAKLKSRALKERIPTLKKFRFVTAEELLRICNVLPGAVPPFGKPVFSNISKLFIDTSIARAETIGFNAAYLDKSIVVNSSDYLSIAGFDEIFDFAE